MMSSIPVCQPVPAAEDGWLWLCIAAGERICAAVLIAACFPLLLIIWVAILALSGRSPLIAHRRIGQNGSELWVLKFRTMWEHPARFALRGVLSVEYIDDQTGPSLKSRHDPRVWSPFARFCRRHSLDEIPQFVHVLSGRMSLVGPRPVTAAELVEIYGPKAEEIVRVKPGVSGLWQISGRNRLPAAERCRLDLECAQRRSLKVYFSVLLRTVPAVITGSGAW